MAGYGSLNRVEDAATHAVLKQLFDLIHSLRVDLTTLEGKAVTRGATIDAKDLRLINLQRATGATDAPTLEQVQQLVDTVKKATY